MNEKKGIAHERIIMCSRFSQRNLSDSVCDMISSHIGSFDSKGHETREAEAKKITEIIDSSTTEAEMLEKLAKL